MEENKSKILKDLAEWGKSLILALIIALLVLKFVVFFAIVPTGSMIPTIHEGDRIMVWRCLRYLDWENRGLTHGDIVVFDFTEASNGEDTKLLVKRVSLLDNVIERLLKNANQELVILELARNWK